MHPSRSIDILPLTVEICMHIDVSLDVLTKIDAYKSDLPEPIALILRGFCSLIHGHSQRAFFWIIGKTHFL
jgi:hypothetical protein